MGEDEEVEKYLERGRGIQPTSIWLAYNYLRSRLPRWGDSHEETQAFLKTGRSILRTPGSRRCEA